MNEQRIADKIARELMADYGDVPYYWNVFDVFEAEGRKLERGEIEMLQGMIMEASAKARNSINRAMYKALAANRADMADIAARGIALKPLR